MGGIIGLKIKIKSDLTEFNKDLILDVAPLEKKTVEFPIFNPTSNKSTTKQVTGTKKQLIDLLKSEISGIEKVVPRFSAASGKGGLLKANDKSWKDFVDGNATIDELTPGIQGYAASYAELKDKLESLEGDVVLPGEQQAAQPQVSDEDTQALDWAKRNPNDPRAAKILKLLGGK